MTAQLCRLPNIPNCLCHTQKKVLETCTQWSEENLRKSKGMLPLVSGQGHAFRSVLTPLPYFPFESRSSWASQAEGHGPRATPRGSFPLLPQWWKAGTNPSPEEGGPQAALCHPCLKKVRMLPFRFEDKSPWVSTGSGSQQKSQIWLSAPAIQTGWHR